jgi:hypothetical protein
MGHRRDMNTHTYTHAVLFNDVYRFSAAANTWTALPPSGSGAPSRCGIGFAATPDGMLYVFGGSDSLGKVGEEGAAYALHMCMYILCTYTQGRGIVYRHVRMCARVLAYAACMRAPSSIRRLRACLRLHAASYALLATSPLPPSRRPIGGMGVVGSARWRRRARAGAVDASARAGCSHAACTGRAAALFPFVCLSGSPLSPLSHLSISISLFISPPPPFPSLFGIGRSRYKPT